MEYNITIEANNRSLNITAKPALYMNVPIWEIILDEKNYLIRKNTTGWDQSEGDELNPELMNKIGNALDYLLLKDAS